MRVLSLTQPWATLIAIGSKTIETRSWSTDYRGPLAIHAAKKYDSDQLLHLEGSWNYCAALFPIGKRMGDGQQLRKILPFGVILAVADLIACRRTERFTLGEIDAARRPHEKPSSDLYTWTERQMGDFSIGRYGFILENVRALKTPIPFKGSLGLRPLPDAICIQIEAEFRA